jgi:pantetheine-phosphate adenylyltransferase
MKIAIYPGTFDPITSGHFHIINSAAKLFDRLFVAIASDSSKPTLFSLSERAEMIKHELENNKLHNVEVTSFSGLMVNFAKQIGVQYAVRGVRTLSDFEYEMQMASMNSILDKEIQTILFPSSDEYQLVSSKLVKEVTKLGGDTKNFLSANVKAKLIAKLSS